MKKQNAFTLIELLVVIAIIAILAISITVGYNSIRDSAKDAKIIEAARSIASAQEIYRDTNGSYADDLEDLDVNNLDADLLSEVDWNLSGSASSWSLSAELNSDGSFDCDQDGCRKVGD